MQTPNDDGAKTPLVFPVLPLRDIVVFPHKIVPLFVGREKSVRALEDVGLEEKQILLVTQKNPAQDEPSAIVVAIGLTNAKWCKCEPAATSRAKAREKGKALRPCVIILRFGSDV